MGQLFSVVWNLWFPNKEYKIVMVSLRSHVLKALALKLPVLEH